ncbi:MAG: UDP-2,3-diacylglucosamine diphosphatase [Planctomycetota bacterium]
MTRAHDAKTTVWFVSDVHLALGDQAYLEQFLAFLAAAQQQAQQLYIVGDLFEFWIGDRQADIEFYTPLFERFRELVEKGTHIGVIHGNRDFLMGSAFTDVGCELLPDEITLQLEGLGVHLSHGDQFCIHDHSYLRARVIMRSKPIRWLAALLPGAVGHGLARCYRGISERKKQKKLQATGNRFHTVKDGIEAELARSDHDLILCGHIHYYADQTLRVGGRDRRVLTTGAWEESPNYVAWTDGKIGLHRFVAGS